MRSKFLLLVIPFFTTFVFSSCLYKNTDKPQTYEEEMLLLAKHIKYISEERVPPATVHKTELGVYYWVIKQPASVNGTFPEIGDTLTIKYNGYLIDGTLFATTDGKEHDFVLGKENVIQGWNDGMKVIEKGSEVQLIIPSPLGFGSKGNTLVPPNNTLIYEITMVNIKKKKN